MAGSLLRTILISALFLPLLMEKSIGLQVVAALRQMADELEAGALLTVDYNRTRLRVLPLK
jgi:predicted nuclease of predicted toxin-antitoxin system